MPPSPSHSHQFLSSLLPRSVALVPHWPPLQHPVPGREQAASFPQDFHGGSCSARRERPGPEVLPASSCFFTQKCRRMKPTFPLKLQRGYSTEAGNTNYKGKGQGSVLKQKAEQAPKMHLSGIHEKGTHTQSICRQWAVCVFCVSVNEHVLCVWAVCKPWVCVWVLWIVCVWMSMCFLCVNECVLCESVWTWVLFVCEFCVQAVYVCFVWDVTCVCFVCVSCVSCVSCELR